MEEEKQSQVIPDLVDAFLQALQIDGSVELVRIHEKQVQVKIKVTDGSQGYVIGSHGATLVALQHLVTLVARKEKSELQYRVDINNYQEDRDQLFLKRVKEYVEEKKESNELLLWPMTPYERRLVHEYFLKAGTHSTESEDFGEKRVVRVVKK